MPSPFPGMDPYLEHPSLWPDVHNELISEMRAKLVPHLGARYVARMDVRALIDQVTDEEEIAILFPDVAVLQRERTPEFWPGSVSPGAVAAAPVQLANPMTVPVRHLTLEIRTVTEERLVTVIEVLSPANKRPGDSEYLERRGLLLSSGVHLLEIDLLRRGRRIPLSQPLPRAPYFVLLSRGNRRPWCDVWPIQLADPLPVIPVPLLGDDPDVPLDLGGALAAIYDRARYDLSIDYTAAPFPPLAEEDAAWADSRLREKGLRPAS